MTMDHNDHVSNLDRAEHSYMDQTVGLNAIYWVLREIAEQSKRIADSLETSSYQQKITNMTLDRILHEGIGIDPTLRARVENQVKEAMNDLEFVEWIAPNGDTIITNIVDYLDDEKIVVVWANPQTGKFEDVVLESDEYELIVSSRENEIPEPGDDPHYGTK